MKVVVIGCGRLGADLTYRLFQKGHQVSVVDEVPASFKSLPADFTGRFIEGDALNRDVLLRAGMETADAVAVVTNSDAINAVVGHLAVEEFKIDKVVVRNYDPHQLPIFEVFGLQVVSSTTWGAQRVEEIIYHEDVHAVFSAGNGEVEIYEFTIPQEMDGVRLDELVNMEGCLVSVVTRGGKSMLPEKSMRLEGCDVVHVSATFEGVDALRKKFRAAAGSEGGK